MTQDDRSRYSDAAQINVSGRSAERRRSMVGLIVGVIAALSVAAVGIWWLTGRGGDDGAVAMPSPTNSYEANPSLDALPRRVEDDPKALGDADAPVTMVMYYDYLCPDCQEFDSTTMPELQQYVDDGILRIEARDLVIYGDEAVTAALGARAAANQGAFWEFHTALMAEQNAPDGGVVTPEHLTELATDLGLDADAFSADLTDADSAGWNELVRDGSEALEFAAPEPPIYVINGVVYSGAVSTEELVDVIAWAYHESE